MTSALKPRGGSTLSMMTRTTGRGVTPRSELASMAASRPGVAGSTTTMAWRLASMLVSARTASAEHSTLTPARRSVAARPPRSSSAGSTTRTPPLIGITESYSNAARSGSSSVRWNRPPSSLRGLEDGAVRAAAHQPLAQLPALDLRGEEIALATRGVEERRGQLRLVARVARHEPRRRLLPGARELHRARQERDALARAVERHAQLLGLRVLGHRRRGLRARRFLQLQLRLGHASGVVEGKNERQADAGQPRAADGAAVSGDEYLRPALRLHFIEQELLLALIERGAIDDGDVDGQQRTAAAEVEDAVVAQFDVLRMLRGDVEAECGVRRRRRDHAHGEGRVEAAHGQRAGVGVVECERGGKGHGVSD